MPVHHASILSCSYHFINAVEIFLQEREVATTVVWFLTCLLATQLTQLAGSEFLKMQADNNML